MIVNNNKLSNLYSFGIRSQSHSRRIKLQYEEDKEEDEEGGDLVTKKEGFGGATCWRCREIIHMYHRYCYTCTICSSSCDDKKVFSLHKFCGELPPRLEKTLHRHPLIQQLAPAYNCICQICESSDMYPETQMFYKCDDCFNFYIDVKCALEVGKNIIYHPSHPHLLICSIPKPILCLCSACGKEHKGIFYQCSTTCGGFTIHTECAFLPHKLLIQQRTHGSFYHTHPLTILYSFPREDQKAKHFPRCRVCGDDFYRREDLWSYKCDKCLYYVHLNCVRVPPRADLSKTIKNYEDVDHPGLLHLPFPDETYSLPKHYLFFQQTTNDDDHHHKIKVDDRLTHKSHQHPLILVDHGQTSFSSSNSLLLIKCHDPMEKTQLLCNACLRPIMSTMPFYKCPHQSCNDFALHEWCTRLPPIIQNHPGHPQHTLNFIFSNDLPFFFGVFNCKVCYLHCNGFVYGCVGCEYYVDVTCGFIPKEITHKAHPNHLLSLVQTKGIGRNSCHICLGSIYKRGLSFLCITCGIVIHPECALLLAETVRHKYDEHPMQLSYLPIENHKSEYFCEICEEDLNPHQSFYHCQSCAQSIHTACAPSILKSETHDDCYLAKGVNDFVNIKFGGIFNTSHHQHPLSFAQGIASDGKCKRCPERLQYSMIFKCLKCNFSIHYHCL
ncbi:unnamed protein product [Lactuca saligna]|uniref:Phorbol-ester/DAG-type domain-containing protein n=1 Tax=Lactuca saligna TaxID=75948 RepID=A0AA35ZU51_LACSI|nr:unnamed protein product [Lactuca saligna]